MTTMMIRGIAVCCLLLLFTTGAFAAVKAFQVQETDFVKVVIDALDLDGDVVSYNFSSPLDELGEWQTDDGDAGEYDVTVTASDGQSSTTKKIKIIVEDRNEPPQLLEKKLTVKEGQIVSLKDMVQDPEDDLLLFTFPEPFDAQGYWQTGYESEGSKVVSFSADDGEFEETFRMEITVLHSNQPPAILQASPAEEYITLDEDETLEFWAEAVDYDNAPVTYDWTLDGTSIAKQPEGEYHFSFDEAGAHNLTLEASDGERSILQDWRISVTNVNRAPELEIPPLTIYENENAELELSEKDADGDALSYEFEAPLDELGKWQTGYHDAGEYSLTVTASDGQEESSDVWKITVLNVDRPPTLEIQEKTWLREGEEMLLEMKSSDPDGEQVRVIVTDLPEGAVYTNETIRWVPSYDLIRRSGGFFSEILNALRLEHSFLDTKEFPLTITSCGSELCTKKEALFLVENTNRPPQFSPVANVSALETEELHLSVPAVDPDGDIVRYYFGDPLGRRNGKWTPGYDDAGELTVPVTASDGQLQETIIVPVIVENKDRLPWLKIDDDTLVVNEFQQFSVQATAKDLDNDTLSVRLRNLPRGASFIEGMLIWEPDGMTVLNKTDTLVHDLVEESPLLNKKFSNDQTTVWLEFAAFDGEVEVVHPVRVIVKNVNRAPAILDYLPTEEVTVRTFEPALFHVAAKDEDGDALTYHWRFGFGEAEVIGTDTVERTFTTPGRKKIQVTISDGREDVVKEFKVNVLEQEYVAPSVPPTAPLAFKVYVIKG